MRSFYTRSRRCYTVTVWKQLFSKQRLTREFPHLLLGGVFTLVILLVVVLWSISSEEGNSSLDVRRTTEMQEIVRALDLYATAHAGMYPESLDVLVINNYLTHKYTDPKTGAAYRYFLSGRAEYAVCTVFADGSDRCLRSTSASARP